MAVKVVDASALAALLFNEPESTGIAEHLQDSTLIAPGLLEFELAHVCLSKCRRHPDQREAILAAFALRRRMAIEAAPVDHAAVLGLAFETDLTAYDASYLWLARAAGAELVTLDQALARAAAAG
jgi:predicted nucleic acid-binding protein